MKKLWFLLALVSLTVACNNNIGGELTGIIDHDNLVCDILYAYPTPVVTPGPPTVTSAVGIQMDYPVKDTITVSIGTADSTENACVKLTWLTSGYPDGVNVGNTMLIADYAPDTSYKVPDHFPENATIYISAWTGNVSGGDTTWSEEPDKANVYLAEGSWPRYGHKFFRAELLRGDSNRVYLATSDYLMAGIEDVSDEYDDSTYEWIDEWQQVINRNPDIVRLAYVTPPYCSRALPDTMPFWHGLMRQLHLWDEIDSVCFYYEHDTTSISAATEVTDSFIVIDDLDKIEDVDSRGVGLSEFTGAVRYLHTDSTREVDYILWNEWADDILQDKDTLFLLNKINPEDYPRMGTDNVNPKAVGDQVTSFHDWGFNIASVLVLMKENRPDKDGVRFENILADSSFEWITHQAVFGDPDTMIFLGVYYDLLGEGAIDKVTEDVNVADTSGINDFLHTQREKFGDDYYFGGNSQQVDDIRMSIMSKFDAITAGELDRPERFGEHPEKDRLLEELHSALLAKRIYHEDGSNDVPFTIIWDDHGGSGTLDEPSDWDKDSTTMAWHRLNLAIATIFGGVHSIKKGTYFYDDQNCWMDEYAVDSTGNATGIIIEEDTEWKLKDDWLTLRYWLGAPTGLIVTQGQELTSENLISNHSFEDSFSGWSTQNVTATIDENYKTDGTYSAKLVPVDHTSPARFYQSG